MGSMLSNGTVDCGLRLRPLDEVRGAVASVAMVAGAVATESTLAAAAGALAAGAGGALICG